eukprot:scaffold8645_cov187-Cylindrotheca_fusiformis.AAC.1
MTVHSLNYRAMSTHVYPALMEVCATYKARGFKITALFADNEYEPIRFKLLNKRIHLETCAANEHQPEAERAVRTIKERNRTTVHGLPYKRYPRLLKREIVKQAARSMNMLPHPDGVSNVHSPRTILTGLRHDVNIDLRVPIGAYCEVHDEPDPSNTELECTTTAIALGATNNMSGSYRFLSLQTGRAIKRSRWNEKPITDAVIEQVHALANAEANAPLEDDLFAYEWAPNVPILNIDRPAPPHPDVPAEGADDTDEEDESEADEDETGYDSEEENEEEEEDPEEEEDEYDESKEEEELSNDDSEDESEEEIIFDPDDGRDDPLFDSYEEEGAHDEEEGAPDEEEGAHDEEEGAPYGVRDQMVEQVETVERPESTDLLVPLQSPVQTATWTTDEPDPMDHGGMPTRIRNRLRSSLSDRYLRRERTSDRALRRARRDRIQKGRGSKVEEVEGELVMDHSQGQDINEDEPEIPAEPAAETIDAPEPRDIKERDTDAMLAQLMERKDTVSEETMAIQSKGWTSQLGKAVDYISKEFTQKEGRDTTAEGFGIHDNISQITNILLAQMSAKKGIKEFGDRAVEAIIKEFDQLDKKKAFKPRKFKSLSVKERRDAL